MPRRVHTDTPIFALRAVWYGPGGTLRPARYTAWVLGVVIALTAAALITIIGPAASFIVNLLTGLVLGPLIAMYLTPRVVQHVDHWVPFKAWVQIVKAELDAPRPASATTTRHTIRPQEIHR